MQISQPRHQSLNILYTNCRSLYNKLDDLRCLTSQHLPHIICLCETWLDDTILDNELLIPPFILVCRDQNRNGGGVTIYIHESIPFKIISKHKCIELLIIHLSLASNPLAVYSTDLHPPTLLFSMILRKLLMSFLPPNFKHAHPWGFKH